MTILPIWKTIEVDMTSELSGGAVDFTVSTGGTIVYEGRAYADLGGDCKVVLNDILRDYLGRADINPNTTGAIDTKAIVAFSVEYGDEAYDFKVINDWSYDRAREYDDEEGTYLTDPCGHWDYRIPRPLTVFGDSEAIIDYYDMGGGDTPVREDVLPISGNSATVFLRPSVPGRVEVSVGDGRIVLPCGEYCDAGALMYRNAMGGYDLLPLASIVETDRYARSGYEVMGNNAAGYNHLRRDYHNAVSKAYALRTPVLTDEQAAKMGNSLGSVQAWLYTPETGFVAVVITADSWKRKTFRNEGRQRVAYEFGVELAQPMERR